jgi:hypothetical protein
MRSRILGKWLVVVLCAWNMVAAAEPATILFVDTLATGANNGSSWTDAYNHLQDALAVAALMEKPVEVRVAQGVYKPDQGTGVAAGDQGASFQLLNAVMLKGGYAGTTGTDPDARAIGLYETILSSDLVGEEGSTREDRVDNTCHIVDGSRTDSTAVMEGFTITAGYVSYMRASGGPSLHSAVALAIDAGSPTLLNCQFTGNRPGSGCILAICNASHPVLTNCAFLDDTGTGIYTSGDSNSVLTNCVFEGGGRDAGPAIMSDGGSLLLTDCTFSRYTHVPISVWDGNLTLVRCMFRDNHAGFGAGAAECQSEGTLNASECVFANNYGMWSGAILADDMELHDCEFTGNSGDVGAVTGGHDGKLIATGCLFSGNSSQQGARAIHGYPLILRLSNCTFVGNRGQCSTLDVLSGLVLPATLTRCIIWDDLNASDLESPQAWGSVTYSDIRGSYPGQGNIDVDPCFVSPGYWDPNGTPDDANDDLWVAGDYHLKSQGGHWDRATESWVRDDVTSLCIDAGDPNNPLGVEPFPNGGIINLGAYGGSAEASKSYFGEPVCMTQTPGDINGDCKVDQTDMDILLAHWLTEGTPAVNIPPTITLISPQDGAELTCESPVMLDAAASDPDGLVIRVRYNIEYPPGGSCASEGWMLYYPADSWTCEWSSPPVDEDTTYTIWADAIDNEGAKTATPKVTITVHPAK